MFVLLVLCAGTLADVHGDSLFPKPSTATDPTRAIESGDNWYGLLRRNVGHMLQKRAEGIRTEKDAQNLDLETWSRETVKLCADKLKSITTASNPAGIAGCWNLPLLVESTGVFAADLRLFRVAEPTGDWKNVDVSTYNISVQYDGSAAIQARNMTEKERKASAEGMVGSKLTKLVDSQFIGNLDHTVLTKDLSDAKLKVMVTPEITIEAVTKDGKPVNTTVSIDDSKFLNGVFANTPDLSAQQSEQVKDAPFEMPGMEIEIIPVGLYFYSAYLLVACAIFGWGTLERAKFRDQYRRRIANQGFR
ncbi:hypothetical protein K440DRAFT_542508 [Wilcoxina mikolae CBS 423.85]|nr:hypothetical protein K440DRAFT_542508 [Wilcoxina mikolae CBS 423.85]